MQNPVGLAFDSIGNLYAANFLANGSLERLTSTGADSILATGLSWPVGVAIIPEPSSWVLAGVGLAVMLTCCRSKTKGY